MYQQPFAACWSEEKVSVPERVDLTSIKDYIEKHYMERIGLEELAKQIFIDRPYLSHAFKQQFGINLFQYLELVRINKVKELLRFGDGSGQPMKLAKIADITGFSSESYLSMRFKKTECISPKEYREKWK